MTAALAYPTDAESPWAWEPQDGPQFDAYVSRKCVDELLFGGAVFGGKTDFLIGDFAQDVDQGAAWVGILFRKSFPELEEVIERSLQIYPLMGAEWTSGTKTWRWPDTGKGQALLRLRSLESVEDFTKYMGFSYSWIGWDELPNHASLAPYHRMKSRLRGPAKYKRIRASGNPGGRCHQEVKEYFGIDRWPTGRHVVEDEKTGMKRMFIRSVLGDNYIGLEGDPGYEDRLEGVGDPELVAAWKAGDWDAIVGAYFSMYRRSECEVDPFEIPANWTLFTCMDYGEANPSWAGLLAVDSDDDVYVVDEYYRANAGGSDHARGIKAMVEGCPYIRGQRIRTHLAPADMWTPRKPGEASQARAPKDSFADEGIFLTRANMDRVTGWRNLKDMLYAKRLKFFRGRTDHVCSSLASVVRDEKKTEDVLKGGDDHPADGLRYGINHVYKPRKLAPKVPDGVGTATYALRQLEALGKPEKRFA